MELCPYCGDHLVEEGLGEGTYFACERCQIAFYAFSHPRAFQRYKDGIRRSDKGKR